MSTSVSIESQDCSPLGLLILEYMQMHQLSFAQMAERLDISRAALRITCDKHGNPGTRLLPRLAQILGTTEQQIEQLILKNELAQMKERNS